MNIDAISKCFLSVVIPAYNEEGRLPLTLNRVYDYLSTRSMSFEVIVVDDGSTDRTVAMAELFFRSRKGGKVLKNNENHGKGFSVKRGVLHAEGQYILFSDADLSTPIEEMEKLLPPITKGSSDIAIASRSRRESEIRVSQPWYRNVMGKIFNICVQLVAVPGIKDTQCGFKCFRRSAAIHTFSQQRLTRFGFDVEILYIARKVGYAVQEIPVVWINSPNSRVHIVTDSARMLFDLGRIRLNDLIGRYSKEQKQTKFATRSETSLRP
jgi:dolichyl-phosphate beta-glucosyltransferase